MFFRNNKELKTSKLLEELVGVSNYDSVNYDMLIYAKEFNINSFGPLNIRYFVNLFASKGQLIETHSYFMIDKESEKPVGEPVVIKKIIPEKDYVNVINQYDLINNNLEKLASRAIL